MNSRENSKRIRGKNKRVPKHLEEIFYDTIKHYPELKESYLIVVESKFYGIQHTLRAYPPFLSLPNKKKNRVYPIAINTNKNIPLSFYSLSKDEQKGILAHEMAHTIAYTKMSSREIILFGLRFAFSKTFTRETERNTDKLAIEKGCGIYLFLERKFFLENGNNADHKKYANQIYLSPTEILQEIKKYPQLYKDAIIPEVIDNKQNHMVQEAYQFPKIKHAIQTIIGFITAISEMIRLVYVKRMHKKPHRYTK